MPPFTIQNTDDKWLASMPQATIEHLPAVNSDHPLLVEMVTRQDNVVTYLRFLHLWTENDGFSNILKNCWNREVSGNTMKRLQLKMKRISATRSRREYGSIFAIVKEHEEKVRIFRRK